MSEILVEEYVEEKRDFDIEGISDTVTKTVTRDMKYPNIEIKAINKNPKKYKLQLLSGMMLESTKELYHSNTQTMEVYLTTANNETVDCGMVYRQQIKAILTMFSEDCEVIANLAKDNQIKGNYVYALCP